MDSCSNFDLGELKRYNDNIIKRNIKVLEIQFKIYKNDNSNK